MQAWSGIISYALPGSGAGLGKSRSRLSCELQQLGEFAGNGMQYLAQFLHDEMVRPASPRFPRPQ